jgi:hypothetical protein
MLQVSVEVAEITVDSAVVLGLPPPPPAETPPATGEGVAAPLLQCGRRCVWGALQPCYMQPCSQLQLPLT